MGRQRWDPGSLWAIEGLLWIDHQHLCVFGNRWKQKEVSAGQNISDLVRDLRNQGKFWGLRIIGSSICQVKDIQGMILVLFKTTSTMITYEFGEILHRYIYMGFRKALKFHQFYFGDELQNLTDVDLEENYKLQEVLEEIKEEDKDIEDAAGKEVNVDVAEKKKGAHKVLFKQSVAAGGTTKKRLVQAFIPPRKRPSTKTTVVSQGEGSKHQEDRVPQTQIQFFQSLMFMVLQVTEEELSEQMEGSGCFVFSFLISSLRSFIYFIFVISWLHGLILLSAGSLNKILIWNKYGHFGFWYYYVLVLTFGCSLQFLVIRQWNKKLLLGFLVWVCCKYDLHKYWPQFFCSYSCVCYFLDRNEDRWCNLAMF